MHATRSRHEIIDKLHTERREIEKQAARKEKGVGGWTQLSARRCRPATALRACAAGKPSLCSRPALAFLAHPDNLSNSVESRYPPPKDNNRSTSRGINIRDPPTNGRTYPTLTYPDHAQISTSLVESSRTAPVPRPLLHA